MSPTRPAKVQIFTPQGMATVKYEWVGCWSFKVIGLLVNPFKLTSDEQVTSLYNNLTQSNRQVMRIPHHIILTNLQGNV